MKYTIIAISSLAIISSCGSPEMIRDVCPPNNTPVYVPKDCSKGYELFTKNYQVSLSTSIETIKIKANINPTINQSISKLAQDLDQRTVRFRTAYIGLCQSQISEPCNTGLQEKILAARVKLTSQYEETEKSLSEISKKLDVLSRTSANAGTLTQEVIKNIESESVKARGGTL